MKSLIVNYDELGNPISLQDVKDFRDNSVVSYQKLCEQNLKRKKERDEAKANEEKAKEAERIKRANIRSAWIARCFYEHVLDTGAETMEDDEYQAFVANFNNGDVKDMGKMPKTFVLCYKTMEEKL